MDIRALKFIRDTLKDKYSYNFTWLGRPFIQVPPDMIAIQELIYKIRPDVVIETGVAHGGGLVFYASILEAMRMPDSLVIGIDIEIRKENLEALLAHEMSHKIILLRGDSIDPRVIKDVSRLVEPDKTVLVILDSLHTHYQVLAELESYAPLVSVGSYIIVMDTIIQFLPEHSYPDKPWDVGNNPWSAVQEFLKTHDNFEIDRDIENRILITSAPDGYLRRIK
jgi:cephalosporin hydroxylase